MSHKRWWAARITALAGRNEIRSYSTLTTTALLPSLHISIKTTTTAIMSKPSARIPVIDISPSNPHAATQLLDAATNYGFVFIENNAAAGMPPANVKNMFVLVSTSILTTRIEG
jgi:hypothetical protein